MAYLTSCTEFGDIEYSQGDSLPGVVEDFNEENGTEYDADDFGWVTSCDYSQFSNLEVCGESLERTLDILNSIEDDSTYAAKIAYLMETDSVDLWDAWRLLEDGNCPDLYEGDAEDFANATVKLDYELQEYFDYYKYGNEKVRDGHWEEFIFDGTTYTIGDR